MTIKSGNNYKQAHRSSNGVGLAGLLFLVSSVSAQPATPGAPNVGTILQQLQPLTPTLPETGKASLTIEANDGSSAQLPTSAPFLVQRIRITRNTEFDTATLLALVADAQGTELTLVQLGELAARITRFYRENGFPLSRAIIPAQTITGGLVRIEVIEAKYGNIELINSSQSRDTLLQATLDSLQSGQNVGQISLDHALLLLSDIPGVKVHATLKPGTAVGTTDMEVLTTPGPRVTGNIGADNYGSLFTGKPRVSGTISILDPLNLKLSDVINLSALTSGGGLSYGRLAYEAVVNGLGTRVGGSYSALRYRLGESVAFLNATGTAQVATLLAKQPLIRSRQVNLYGQIQYDQLQLNDRVEISETETNRHLNTWTLSLMGDARDGVLSGGVSTGNLSWSAGRVNFNNRSAQLADAASAGTQGGFSKWNINLARLQSLGASTSLYVAYAGQWANHNLDSSQKMSVGGPYTVRAYDLGAISGDSGQLFSVELRQELGQTALGQWQGLAFVDRASMTINKNPWVEGTNTATLSGAGLGISLNGVNQWSAKAYVAKPIGSSPTLLSTKNKTRLWLEARKGF